MPMLLNTQITPAVAAAVTAPLQMRPVGGASPIGLTAQSNFVYGSGGTSGTVWVQTSLDEGLTWCDVAAFAFTTASLRQALGLGTLALPVATANPFTPTDGTSGQGSVSGLIGSLWRTKLTTVRTYAGTTLRVNIDGIGFTSLT